MSEESESECVREREREWERENKRKEGQCYVHQRANGNNNNKNRARQRWTNTKASTHARRAHAVRWRSAARARTPNVRRALLPAQLSAIIDRKFLCLHGGLSPDIQTLQASPPKTFTPIR